MDLNSKDLNNKNLENKNLENNDLNNLDENNTEEVFFKKHFRYEKQLILFLLFYLYSYSFSMVQSYFTTLARDFFDTDRKVFYAGLSLAFYAAGLLLCAVFLSFKRVKASRLRLAMGIVTLISPPFLMLYFTYENSSLFLISFFVLMIFSGIQGVYVYKLMYESISPASHTGKVYGLAVSCSILTQYVFQMRVKNTDIILFSLIIVAFFTAFMFFSGITKKSERIEQLLPDSDNEEERKKGQKSFRFIFISFVIVMILLEFTGNFLSYPLLALMSDGKPIVYSTPRLFIMLAYLFMGIIADIEELKYIPAITFVGVLIGILNPVLLHDPAYIYLNTCIYYVVAGTINSFLALMSWKLAKGKKNAPLISVSGRVIDSIFSFVFVSSFWAELSLSLIIGLELIAIIIIMILFAFSGYFNFSSEEETIVEHITPEEFAQYFEFTDKETEVFTAAMSHSGTMSELAGKLFISRSILYRNINNICSKTAQDNLQEVKHLYYQMPVKKRIASQVWDNEDISENVKNDATSYETEEEINSSALEDKLEVFAETYSLTPKETEVLKLFVENPGKTQKELAELQGTSTLRTIQRHLANIRTKTNTKSLVELSVMFDKMGR